jgi:predicted component of type VI protein secretion system
VGTGSRAVPKPQQQPAQSPQPATPADHRESARAREAERAAWQRIARAEADVAHTRAQESAANDELDRIASEITRLRAALDAATQRARSAKGARQAAERALNLARRDVPAEEQRTGNQP